ncbi:Uncharacterised protein [Mycobacteroides abscessus subsp. massiliense]|nr:Uncharacterised protein [Mycobacteroides abscessus subsp. massiliense]SKY74225.1 Uncharacterised protein [Mycobacteroides abscessus subsp. massiliense]
MRGPGQIDRQGHDIHAGQGQHVKNLLVETIQAYRLKFICKGVRYDGRHGKPARYR